QPVISGDGKQIAFASDAPMAGNMDRNQEIFRYGIEHGRVVDVTDSTASVFPGFNLSPSIDESGGRIVFASDHNLTGQNPDANLEIYLYDRAYVFDHISADGYHTCGVRIDGQVECWGRPYEGQSSPPAASWAGVSAGFYHTCGLQADRQVECWGNNQEGQSSPPTGPFTQISAGGYHTCGLRPDGLVECWGRNLEGQSSPPGDTFIQVTAGYLHTCGLRPNGSVACWGFGAYGQSSPPAGIYSQVSAGVWHSCGLRDDGSVACWGDSYGGQLPPTGTFTAVSAGYGHSCGLRPEGSVECWGDPSYGKSSPPSGSFHQISAGIWHSCGVRDDGLVACWGRNDYGQAQAARGGPTLEQVTVSESNTNAQPSLSGNGQYVAFVSDRDGNPEIFVARLDVAPIEVIQVTHTGVGVTHAQPSISHDGQRIAFVSDQDGNPEIYILDWDTTPVEVVQITNTGSGVMNDQPSLSGTGQYIAFVSDEDGNPEIFVARLDVDPIDTVQITATGEGFSNDQPSMDGFGRRIAFISDGNLDGGNGDGNPELFVSTCGINLPPVALQVTKDGEHAAYAGQGFAYTITVTNTDGTNVAFDVGLVDTLEGPGTVSPVGSLCKQGSGLEQVTCHLGQLLPNQSETFLIWARVAANASPNDRLDNSVRITAVNSGDARDTFATTVVKGTDISVRKFASSSSVRAGEPITYTINVRHEFGGPATVVLTDTLTGDLSVPPGDPVPDCGDWVGSAGAYTLTCNLGQVNLGSSVALTFAITPRQVGVITNTVAVATTNVEDPLPDNNVDTLVLWPPPIHLPMVMKGH
ncbi:MAG TPA: hypothetical protein VLY63_21030, partial [Anaerolineae bacterium]|nr:hypothetical protein [Anaerolineae bacterium]